MRALAGCNGNQTEAAERLGVSKQAVDKFVTGQTPWSRTTRIKKAVELA
jgi:hypothetical protein